MLSVINLVQQAYELVSLVGDGEAVSGDQAASAVTLLNQLLSELNNQEYLALQCATVEVSASDIVEIRSFDETEPHPSYVVNSVPPDRILGVSIRYGQQWQPLVSTDRMTLDMADKSSWATCYTYDLAVKDGTLTGTLTLNGKNEHELRIYYQTPLPNYTLSDTIYLSDLYNNMILQGLCLKLCRKYKLKEYQADFQEEFDKACHLIKRNTADTRQLRDSIRPANSYYMDGLNGRGLHV